MGKARSVAVAFITGSLIVTSGGPALAAEAAPLVVTSTGLTDGQAVGSQSRFHPAWNHDADIAKVSLYVNGKLAYTTTNWTPGLRVPLTPAQDGTRLLITVRAYDSAGAWAEASTTVIADETFPTASFSPEPGMLQRAVFTVTASDVSDDVAEIALVSPAGVKVATATSAPWTISYDSIAGPAGVHIAVTDRAGNTRQYRGYVIDNTPPAIRELDFFGYPVGRVRGLTQLRVPFSDSSGVNHDEWRVDGILVQSRPAPTNPNQWYDSSTLTYDFGTTQRTCTLQVLARDRAGNESTKTFTVIVDATGPSITSISPANAALVHGPQITSSVRANDPAGIADAVLNNTYGANDPRRLSVSIPAGADGPKTLTWKVHDQLYNESTVTRYVIVDNTKPTLNITKAPKNGAKVKGTVKVTASASDRNGISRVELLINGKVVAKDATADYSFSINTKKYGKKIRIQLRTYDKAGNLATTATRTWHR